MIEHNLFATTYDRDACAIGIVHVGYGAFHRAHQAVFIDDIMQATGDLRWGIASVNLRQSESAAFAIAAAAEDGYTVKTIAPDGTFYYRLVRPHIGFIDAATAPDQATDLLALDTVQMVTITVTESGYYLNEYGALDLHAATIAAELAGAAPETIYAYLAKALEKRRVGSGKPLTILCCDNMRGNGHFLESALHSYLSATNNDALASWVKAHVTFPCSMVDRITPRSTPALQAEISNLFPAHAAAPVHAETFLQWVIEDNFAAPMPDLAKAGVEIVSSVEPFEEAKIRILNGGHTVLAYLGALAGHQTFDQAMRDPDLSLHFDRFEEQEVLPGLGDNIPFDTSDYLATIARRFENKGIADDLERICMDGYSKMAIYVKPTLEACLQKGIMPEAGFDSVASWVVYARKQRTGECAIPYHEPYWDVLAPQIEPGREEEIASNPQIWGDLPQRFECFVPSLVAAIQRMDQKWRD